MSNNLNIFGHERPVLKFWVMMAIIVGASLLGRYIVCLIEKDSFNWSHYTFFLMLCALVAVSYFVGRLIAYKTKIFSKAQNRDNVLKWTFGILTIVLIVVAIVLV
jgi:hypothetical protein